MTTFHVQDTVGSLVTSRPALSHVFERAGVDYCCGGRKTLEEVCQQKGLDPQTMLAALEESVAVSDQESFVDAAAMSLTELVDHIVQTHHAYLRTELPRLDAMTAKVVAVHGEKDPRLARIRQTLLGLAQDMHQHTMKEERILFPMIQQLDASETTPIFHCGSVSNPIRQMEREHDGVGGALEKLRDLTDGYTPPDWACNTCRAMLDGLAQLESDTHQHIHKENNVLFPRAIAMEGDKRS